MSYVLAFYDSEVREVRLFEGEIFIEFSAANVTRIVDDVSGYMSDVRILIKGVDSSDCDSNCFGRLRQGQLVVNENRKQRIPIPFNYDGSIEIELSFSNGSEVRCVARAIRIEVGETGMFLESSNC